MGGLHPPVLAFYPRAMTAEPSSIEPDRPKRAGVPRRLAALFMDGIILAAAGFVLLGVLTLVLGPSVTIDMTDPASTSVDSIGWRAMVNAILLAGMSAAYFVLSWTRWSQSPGQRLFGLRVNRSISDRAAGRPLAMRQAILRWSALGGPLGVLAAATVNAPLLFAAVSAGSFCWFALLVASTGVSRSGRGLHDRLSASSVIRG